MASGRNTNGSRSGSRRFLPPDPRVTGPYRLTTQIAVRIGLLGTLALVTFAVLFLRLWALQVLSGDQYLRTAQENQLRTVRLQAPRGPIVDRYGRVLVKNVPGTALQIWPADLPKKRPPRLRELRAISRIVRVPIGQIATEIRRRKGDPLTPVTVKYSIREDQVAYLKEHATEFPGVVVTDAYLRHYPYGRLAAQVLGYVTEISADQLKRERGYHAGDKIGQTGLEAAYDRYLRGRAGVARLRVDSLGRPRSALLLTTRPQSGHALRLTLDAKLQLAAERALRYGIELAHENEAWAANGGAIVALDPRNGAVRAMASNPTYHPGIFSGRIKLKRLASAGLTKATAAQRNTPALNRATGATYPPGSTFKPVTAIAAMEEHLISPYGTLPCTGSYTVEGVNGNDHTFNNWDLYVNEQMTLPTAIARSCDTYFYRVGHEFYKLPPWRGHPLQAWASRLGFGLPTGFDLPEESGLLPTPEWRQKRYTKKTDPCCWEVDRLWKPGDSIQLAIGQKDLLVTPLQMARFYALVANGGRLVEPHVVEQVEQPASEGVKPVVLRRFTPPPAQRTNVDPQALEIVREGLDQATQVPYGTAYGVFSSFPIEVAGKTGTAEKVADVGDGVPRLFDQSWWCGYGPVDNPALVVCALIENGGHGGTAAAPTALKVFERFFGRRAPMVAEEVHSD